MDACMHVCQVTSVVSDSLGPYGLQPSRLFCLRDFLGKNTGVGCRMPSSRDPPNPGIKHLSPALAGGFFTTEPPGFHFHLKPLIKSFKNTSVSLGIY